MKRYLATITALGICLAVISMLVAPIATYISKFGSTISSNHEHWSQMGSAMSGIYGPILAFLAFGVLIMQVQMQSASNKHIEDQAHVQQADADVTFYLSKLEDALEKVDSDGTVARKKLESLFAFATIEELRGARLLGLAKSISREHRQLFAAWCAYQAIIAGLLASRESLYAKSLSSAQQRAIVVLSYDTCVALDNFVWCVCEGRLKGPYMFSDLSLPQ